MMISVENLTKRYGAVTALDGLTFAIEPGVVGLVGANGAGKSTMIKILLGLLPATTGGARVLDLDVATDGPTIRQRVGYMPEHDCLPADMSATEFVLHMARMSGLPLTAARERTADTLRHVGLYEERYRSMGGYSTGMKQRVKLAQALVHDPGMLLLDEPTNGLDPAGRDQMLALLRRIGTEFGIPMLVTSHLLGELEQVCDHIVVVDGGRLLRSTSTADVTSASRILAIEVNERVDDLGRALHAAGLSVHPAGRQIEVELVDDSTYDIVLDTVVQLGVGLHRLERRRHRMAEIFRADPTLDPNGQNLQDSQGAPNGVAQSAAAELQQRWASTAGPGAPGTPHHDQRPDEGRQR
ncbi:ABC transporter ATP-binding protein [Kineosporia mesophila]|uniref:ABC transporter ATP-binding protein n=2 Tax=Kineosporia mesophila TaxID=566012 RepID=A0ABP6Z5M9_9ACTN|nr:ABC transporter ATP-binding protein [Kineosporia mesophila]MCD5353632.1 ABC transporter ATP-binding protein [Kineosporia mesophila]